MRARRRIFDGSFSGCVNGLAPLAAGDFLVPAQAADKPPETRAKPRRSAAYRLNQSLFDTSGRAGAKRAPLL